jgi:uncharacterized membrane protein YphA (DoxX/SURF4 family)
MNNHDKSNRLASAKNIGLWALQILTAAAFLATGFMKLSGHPMTVETFEKVGVGQWFRYAIGLIEVSSALLLLVPRLTPVGAALVLCTMIGATFSHLFVLGGSALPAMLLGCFALLILWGRFETVKAWLEKISLKPQSATKIYPVKSVGL